MKISIHVQKGFTLIELLFVVAMIGVLYGISIQTFKTYKESAYNAVVDQTIRDISQALDVGKMDLDEMSDGGSFSVFISQDGTFTGDKQIVPALVASKNINAFVTLNLSCKIDYSSPSCLSKWISVSHCKGKKGKILTIYNDGKEIYQSLGITSCS